MPRHAEGGAPPPTAQADEAPPPPASDPVRLRILRAAAQAFGEHGYAATPVEAILELACVSRRTFYKKFRSKEDVLRQLFGRSVRRLLRAVAEAGQIQGAAAGDPAAATRAAVEAYVGVLAEAGPIARVLLQEHISPDSPVAAERERAQVAFMRLLSEGAQLRGAPTPDPLLVSGVAAAIHQICFEMSEAHPGGGWDLDRAHAAILRVISALDG